jgi:hypothetical protein
MRCRIVRDEQSRVKWIACHELLERPPLRVVPEPPEQTIPTRKPRAS